MADKEKTKDSNICLKWFCAFGIGTILVIIALILASYAYGYEEFCGAKTSHAKDKNEEATVLKIPAIILFIIGFAALCSPMCTIREHHQGNMIDVSAIDTSDCGTTDLPKEPSALYTEEHVNIDVVVSVGSSATAQECEESLNTLSVCRLIENDVNDVSEERPPFYENPLKIEST